MTHRVAPAQRVMVMGTAFVAAPVFMLVYGVVRLLWGRPGPGPGWTIGHLAFLVSLVLFGVVLLGLRRLAESRRRSLRVAADVSVVAGMLGLVASIVQVSVDIVAGIVATDHAAMSGIFDAFQSIPGVVPAVYAIGPQLLFAALIALSALAAAAHRMHPAATAMLIIGTALIPLTLNLLPATALCYLAAMTPTALTTTRHPTTPPPVITA